MALTGVEPAEEAHNQEGEPQQGRLPGVPKARPAFELPDEEHSGDEEVEEDEDEEDLYGGSLQL